MTIFESAVKKLTAWYVSALFVVCLFFSVPIYVISVSRLETAARKQTAIVQDFQDRYSLEPTPRLSILRDQQIRRDRQQLLRSIIMANLLLLLLGAYFSYQFAKHTLKPIEEAHEKQARFATDASHELRTPLATMQAEIEVALRDKTLNVTGAKEVLNSNLGEIARLRTLSEQLLNLTRLDTKKVQRATVSLGKAIADELKAIGKRHKLAIKTDIAKNISIHGDERLLRQLIDILVENAIKYAGDKPPDIQVALKKHEGIPILTVTDQGIGIKASELPHIFDRFYRGTNATKAHSSGHGLGLGLAKQIVEAHGGIISADSQHGGATVFHIEFGQPAP